jgi:chemotaxis methyl-accepting protein methylase
VTHFYRDSTVFEYLSKNILPRIFKGKGRDDLIRIWSAGCATGEEAYSLALLCADRTMGVTDSPKVQIFATDIDSFAIAKAREGCYTINDLASVPAEQINQFFIQRRDDFLIKREVREMILFAEPTSCVIRLFHRSILWCAVICLSILSHRRNKEHWRACISP